MSEESGFACGGLTLMVVGRLVVVEEEKVVGREVVVVGLRDIDNTDRFKEEDELVLFKVVERVVRFLETVLVFNFFAARFELFNFLCLGFSFMSSSVSFLLVGTLTLIAFSLSFPSSWEICLGATNLLGGSSFKNKRN